MNSSLITAWRRLISAARSAPDDRDVTAPFGFSTRVAALAWVAERPVMVALFGRFSARALVLAALVTIASVAANLDSIMNAVEDATPQTDLAVELSDIS